MKKLCVLFLLAIITKSSTAQSSFPTASDSVTWGVCFYTYSPASPNWSSVTAYYRLNTWHNVCGNTYSVVEEEGHPVEHPQVLVRNEGDKVYLRRGTNCSDKEYLLYDFSLNLGDTVTCGIYLDMPIYEYPYMDTTKFWVVDVDTVNQERVLSMEYFVSQDGPVRPMTWTTGIGSDKHPFYPMSTTFDYCECDENTLCLSYPNDSVCNCDYTYISIPEIENNDFEVYPNPTDGKFTVQSASNKGQVSIYNTLGGLVFETQINSRAAIDLSDKQAGIYYLIFRADDGNLIREKLIKN